MKKVGQFIRESISEKIREGVQKRHNTFVVTFSKMSSPQMNDFRKALSRAGAHVYVSKNRVARKVLADMNYKDLSLAVKEQTAFIWGDKDSVEIAKTILKFSKDFHGLIIHGGVLDGKAVIQDDVKRLSELPSREILLTMLAQTMQSPLTRLARALNSKTSDLINILKQLSEKVGGK